MQYYLPTAAQYFLIDSNCNIDWLPSDKSSTVPQVTPLTETGGFEIYARGHGVMIREAPSKA